MYRTDIARSTVGLYQSIGTGAIRQIVGLPTAICKKAPKALAGVCHAKENIMIPNHYVLAKADEVSPIVTELQFNDAGLKSIPAKYVSYVLGFLIAQEVIDISDLEDMTFLLPV